MAENPEGNANLDVGSNPTQGAATAQGVQTPELMIPKRRYDEVNQLYREAESRYAQLQKEIESYKGKDEKIAELEKQIKDMQASYELEKSNAKKMSAIDSALGQTSIDPDVVKKLINMDKISIDDNGVTGLDEQLAELKKSKPYLWKKAPAVAEKSAKTTVKPEKSYAQQLAERKIKNANVVAKSKTYF